MPPGGLHTVTITDLADPRLADFAGLRQAHAREQARAADAAAAAGGAFIAEGDLVIRLLIGSRFRVRSVLVAERRVAGLTEDLARLPGGTPIYIVSQGLMNELVGFDIHRGALAVGERGPGLSSEEVLARSNAVVIMEDLANHDNVGGIFRCIAALGGPRPGVLVSPRCADPLYRKAIRVSMGHILRVPFAVLEDWPGGLDRVRAAGWRVIGLTPGPSSKGLRDVKPTAGPVALVVGTEGPGLTDGALARAGELVKVEMTPGVDSLNVTVATAVALHRLVDPEAR